MSSVIWGGGGGPPAYATVRINRDGTVEVLTGAQDLGTGARTVMSQVAAEVLGAKVSDVRTILGDTERLPFASNSLGSITTASVVPAVRVAAEEARDAQFAEVEVDVETGHVRVTRVASVHDSGRIVNPALAERQVEGGVLQGIGYALFEERVLDARLGLPMNPTMHDYKVPTIADVPAIDVVFVDAPDTVANHTGIKGLAEPPIIGVAAAVANAVTDALGGEMNEILMTPWRVLRGAAFVIPSVAFVIPSVAFVIPSVARDDTTASPRERRSPSANPLSSADRPHPQESRSRSACTRRRP